MILSSWIPRLSTSRIWSKGYCLKIEGYGEVSRFVLLSSFELHSVILGYKRVLQKSPSFFQHFQHHYLTSICIMKGMKRTLIPVECTSSIYKKFLQSFYFTMNDLIPKHFNCIDIMQRVYTGWPKRLLHKKLWYLQKNNVMDLKKRRKWFRKQ